jgi:hypothetical protein
MWIRRALTLVPLLALLLAPAAAVAGDPALSIEAMLIHASNNPAPLDTRLDKVEYKLRRVFQFEHYRYYGGATVPLTVPGASVMDLGHNNKLTVNATGSHKGRVEASLKWENESGVVLNTTVVMSRGVPVILGGGMQEGGTLILSITAH